MYVIKWKPVLASVFIALLLFASVACNGLIGAPGAGGGARYIYIEPEVTISHLPKLYEPFTVTGKATALRQDLADAELWLNVTNAVYLDGEDRWHGPLKKREEKTISATFAFVTEGNQNVAALAVADPELKLVQPGLSSPSVSLNVWETFSGRGLKRDSIPTAYAWRPGDPHIVPGGHLILADTTLQLNRATSPRIEIIDSKEDLLRLQSEGLVPQDLRYQWRFLHPERIVDFSKQFLIALYDVPRPVPGHLILMEYKEVGNFIWDAGTLKADLKTHGITQEENESDRMVSSIAVYKFGRADTPGGLPTILAFQGTRTFQFSLDGQPLPPITIDLKTPEESKAP